MRCDLARQPWVSGGFPNVCVCVCVFVLQANIKNVGSLSSLHPVLRVTGHTVYRTRNNRSCVLVCVRVRVCSSWPSGWVVASRSSLPCCPQRP